MNKFTTGYFFLSLLFLSCASSKPTQDNAAIDVQKIWDAGNHNAFTDLIRYNNAFYCTFREGSAHVQGWDGKARVIKSTDGKNWSSVALFSIAARDIRDPKISITPDNRLMILMDVEANDKGKVTSRKPYVSFAGTDDKFSEPKESEVDKSIASWSDWVWRVAWYNGTGYSVNYQPNGFYLLKTTDGSRFEKVTKLDVTGYPNESTIRFDKNGKAYFLIRREAEDKKGLLAVSDPPYQNWTYHYLDQRLGGPNFIFLDDKTLVIGSRLYPSEEIAGEGNKRHQSAVFVTDLNGKIKKTIVLPSGGDTSYPGMVVYDNMLWYSYYSSHEGKTSIYFAKIPLKQLK
ncbi:glycoside hydrolase family 32 protein [Flavisolibacter ginsenosidimutans]|uniref:Glycoside hydrolase family 32 protein n=1 Tax=Flavisolibacter ginsenosidimutans TaxID=661481 RepID=A0A5B8UDK2_9BACT|nr:glycoside hydrolase family 32 protein [Flavisolibacter ginsenosidimutans]QEC54376.1 glycoside hydrolase family 32 protein [Flavisolibacter ginsenosidimutans]